MKIKYSYKQEAEVLTVLLTPYQRRNTRNPRSSSVPNLPQQIYFNKLCIPTAKFNDLDQLCKKIVIPSRYHEEYANMAHLVNVAEALIDTDDEDVTDVEEN